jgi:protein ImuA
MPTLAHATRPARLAALKARLGRLERASQIPAPDHPDTSLIPEPAGCLTESVPDAYLETPSAFAFLAAMAARAASLRPGPVVFSICERSFDFGLPNPAALAASGLSPGRIVLVRAPDLKGALWALEEGARTRGVAAAVGLCLPDRAYGLVASRRLALAAERTGVPVLLLRAPGSRAPSAARARWRVQGAAGAAAPFLGATGLPGLSLRRWRVTQEKSLGAPVSFEVEWNETALRFDPPAALVGRPAAAERIESAIRAA